jgi:uncharacterized membrane protein HdeD (DUF308 family)
MNENGRTTMSISQRDIDQLQRAAVASLHEHWKFYLIEGIILVALGAAAVVAPQVATVAVTILLGWVFLISGIVGLFTTFWMRGVPGFWWSLLSAVLAIIVGVMLGVWPLQGAISLTFVLIAFFFVEGVASIMFALEHKRDLPGAWGWMFASGLVDLILGGVIVAGLPGAAEWAIGLLVAINMVFGGVALVAMALQARRLELGVATAI